MSTAVARLRPARRTLQWAIPLLAVELFAILAYAARPDVTILTPLYLILPFVWVNVGLWAVLRVDPPTSSHRATVGAILVGVAYFVVLAVAGGLIILSAPPTYVPTGVRVGTQLPPGYAPTLYVLTDAVQVVVMPYKAAGYAVLSYLVTVRLLEASGTALSGLLGVFACVSCTWPVIGAVAAAVFGGSSGIAAVALDQAYLLSTGVFLSAVALLLWRPSW